MSNSNKTLIYILTIFSIMVKKFELEKFSRKKNLFQNKHWLQKMFCLKIIEMNPFLCLEYSFGPKEIFG